MRMKSQILRKLKHHLNHNQMVSRVFPQFPFRSIATTFHLPAHHNPPLLLRPFALNMSSEASPNPPPVSSAPSKTVKVVIEGTVTFVHYRDFTVKHATELGLKGWVRNREDGCVEALFSGDAKKVDEMLKRCRVGSTLSEVTKVDAHPSTEDPGTGFIRHPVI